MRKIKVNYTKRESLQDQKETTLYSKASLPLVVTKEISSELPTRYVVTHKASGLAVVRTHKLAQAFQAMRLILPLGDWSKDRSALEYDMDLLDKIREALLPLKLQVTTRPRY